MLIPLSLHGLQSRLLFHQVQIFTSNFRRLPHPQLVSSPSQQFPWGLRPCRRRWNGCALSSWMSWPEPSCLDYPSTMGIWASNQWGYGSGEWGRHFSPPALSSSLSKLLVPPAHLPLFPPFSASLSSLWAPMGLDLTASASSSGAILPEKFMWAPRQSGHTRTRDLSSRAPAQFGHARTRTYTKKNVR